MTMFKLDYKLILVYLLCLHLNCIAGLPSDSRPLDDVYDVGSSDPESQEPRKIVQRHIRFMGLYGERSGSEGVATAGKEKIDVHHGQAASASGKEDLGELIDDNKPEPLHEAVVHLGRSRGWGKLVVGAESSSDEVSRLDHHHAEASKTDAKAQGAHPHVLVSQNGKAAGSSNPESHLGSAFTDNPAQVTSSTTSKPSPGKSAINLDAQIKANDTSPPEQSPGEASERNESRQARAEERRDRARAEERAPEGRAAQEVAPEESRDSSQDARREERAEVAAPANLGSHFPGDGHVHDGDYEGHVHSPGEAAHHPGPSFDKESAKVEVNDRTNAQGVAPADAGERANIESSVGESSANRNDEILILTENAAASTRDRHERIAQDEVAPVNAMSQIFNSDAMRDDVKLELMSEEGELFRPPLRIRKRSAPESEELNKIPNPSPRKKFGKRSISPSKSVEYYLQSRREHSSFQSTEKRNLRQTQEQPQASPSNSRFPSAFCDFERDSGILCPNMKRGQYLDQFYFEPQSNRCYHFVYNGCGGNANRFSSLWECALSCSKAQPNANDTN